MRYPLRPMAHLRPSAYQLTQLQRLPQADGTDADLPSTDVKLEFARSPRELFEIVSTCNGCGRCRTTSEAERMCPMFRILPAEEATPRSKANILLGLFTGAIDRSVLASHELRAVTDLCFNCQQCRNECPAGVDIPRLVLECKAQHVAENGLRLIDWWLGRIDLVAAWLSPFRSVVNFGLRSRRFRWLLERMFGLARRRKLPVIEKHNFIQWAAKRQLTRRTRAAGQQGRLLHRHLLQLVRRTIGHCQCRRAAPQRCLGVRAAATSAVRHGPHRRRCRDPRQETGTTESAHLVGSHSPGLPHRRQRTLGRPLPHAGIPTHVGKRRRQAWSPNIRPRLVRTSGSCTSEVSWNSISARSV